MKRPGDYKTITCLDISNCKLNSKTANVLKTSIANNYSIVQIDITNNPQMF
jgi:hypothetical protein